MSTLQDLKQRIMGDVLISTVVGQYIPITRKGTSTLAVCPFHDDHKPSMNVTDDRRYFKCFACGEGGNAIDFVMKYKNLDFKDALKEISEQNGIRFEDYITSKTKSPRALMAEKILTRATSVFQKMAETKQFPAFEDFLKTRNLSHEISHTYNLGFAPKYSAITEYLYSISDLADKSLALSVATEIGLIRENSPENQQKPGYKSHYDTFRERIMFPIWDHFGQVIGYTSRKIHDYQKAKYMNSKESFVFNKSMILYGLHLAKNNIRERDSVLLVEGNMDQMTLFHKGFRNTVAIQGIAISDHSIRTLKSLTKNFYLTLDNDAGGFSAMKRINAQCLAEGITPKYVNLDPAKDPDEFLNEFSTIEFQKRIDEAKTFIDVELESIIPEFIPEILDAKLILLNKAFSIVAPLGTGLGATERLVKVARMIGLNSDSASITENYKDFLGQEHKAPKKQKNEEYQEVENLFQDEFFEENYQPNALPPLLAVEKRLIRELIKHPECLIHQEISDLLDFVSSNEVKKYLSELKDLFYEIDEKEYSSMVRSVTLANSYGQELTETALQSTEYFVGIDLPTETLDQIMKDLRTKLEEDHLKTLRRNLNNRKSQCQTENDLNKLMKEIIELDKKLIDLNNQKFIKP
ncbi:MAG: DNA primase [Bacteriovoracaceae bacterium]|jgi:DNA primase|nr:DNA primase [Bacteriovoracaceae bacterium]